MIVVVIEDEDAVSRRVFWRGKKMDSEVVLYCQMGTGGCSGDVIFDLLCVFGHLYLTNEMVCVRWIREINSRIRSNDRQRTTPHTILVPLKDDESRRIRESNSR
jgi:hypothetical protein